MVDSIKPTYSPVPVSSPSKRGVDAPESAQGAGHERWSSKPLFVERRKKRDRRRESDERPIYDMRVSRGRRKTDRIHPSIETKA